MDLFSKIADRTETYQSLLNSENFVNASTLSLTVKYNELLTPKYMDHFV
jgi:hypothetical protein